MVVTTMKDDGREQTREVERLRVQFRILTDAMRTFAEATADPDILLDTIAMRTAEALHAFCGVAILSINGLWLEPVASFDGCGPSGAIVRQLISAYPLQSDGPHPLARALQTGASVLLPALTIEQLRARYSRLEDQQTAIDLSVKSLLFVPLRARGQSLGGLSLIRYGADPTVFDESDVVFAQHVADHAALAINNGRLLVSVQQELIERQKAEDALLRTAEQLRHSQKMDAIGRLAGGVAHDFNNLLSIILSYSELLVENPAVDEAIRVDLREIQRAGLRASDLTRQLLAFSRQQVLSPKIVDLNTVLKGMESMLRRLVGEDIDLRTVTSSRRAFVKVDPGQFEQVLMNLVVNARDAMPRGGTLTLETAEVELDETYTAKHAGARPGLHIMLAVTDTGQGMDAVTQSRIFEPFFTTKEQGKGTGLGLSMVFGIVQQSGGTVWVYSELGTGTTFKIYLPRAEESAALTAASTSPAPSLKGSETILLAEDDPQLRVLTRTLLERLGYLVLDADGAEEALHLCMRFSGPIHLLLTDVVMPKVSGRELAERLAALRPQTKVLFMSGYTDDTIVRHGVLTAGIAFLQKPITPDVLARKVREVLDMPVEGGPLPT